MSKIIIILFFSALGRLFSQDVVIHTSKVKCDYKKIVDFDAVRNFSNYSQYCNNFYSIEELKHFNKLQDLIEIAPLFRLPNNHSFKYKNQFIINLALKDTFAIFADNDDYLYNKDSVLYAKFGISKKSIGFTKLDSNIVYFNYVKEILIEDLRNKTSYSIPSYIYNDLINVNELYKYKSVLPISCFKIKNSDSICIYIAGKTREYDKLEKNAIPVSPPSFLVKIIYNTKTKTVHRIKGYGWGLYAYGWMWCENFWPF